MKKNALVLITLFVPFAGQNLNGQNYILLKDPAIGWIDGVHGAMDAEVMRDCLDVRRIINNIFHGEKNLTTGLYEKRYSLEGHSEKVALNDLVHLELDYQKQGISLTDKRFRGLYACLSKIKEDFLERTKVLLESANETMSVNMRIVKEWTAKAQRTNSHLLLWGTENELEVLMQLNAQETKLFFLDLQNFMKDLMFSCPKARKMYAEAHIDTPKKRELFESLFKE